MIKFDTGTYLIPSKMAVGSKGLLSDSMLYSDAERINGNYIYTSPEPQPLNLHFCFPTKQWIPAPGVFISLRFAAQPADKSCCSATGHCIFLKKMEI